MFCKNCGEKLNDNQAICLKCGVSVGQGKDYCVHCGGKVGELASTCLNCGCAIQNDSDIKKSRGVKGLNGKDKTTTAILCGFLGSLGVHNFYMGENKKGAFKIILTLLCGIGVIFAIIDLVNIITDNYKYDPNANF